MANRTNEIKGLFVNYLNGTIEVTESFLAKAGKLGTAEQKAMIKIRKELNVIKNGNYKEYNKLSSKVYMYSREDSNQKVLVICSFSEKETKLKVPSNFNLSEGELILNNYENNSLILKPYETRVYLWKK